MGGIAGFAVLTLVSYILVLLHISVLFVPILILCILLVTKPLLKVVNQISIKFDKVTVLTIIVFVVGILGQLAIISPSGIFSQGNLLFWSANGHDGAWHIALMEEIKRGWPFQNPVFAGEKLVNYHFFSDMLPALISKYFPISNLDLYFRIFPIIYSLFLGASAYFLTKRLTGNRLASIWATIFTYFAGSLGFIVTYIKNKAIGGESIFWATQPQSASGNPPQIISDFMLLASVYFMIILAKEQDKKKKSILFAISVVLFGTLASFKVYAGLVALASLGIVGLFQLVKERRPQLLLLTAVSGILSAALYLPNTSGGASFLIFQPWWYIRTMVVEPSRLDWIDLELRRQFYLDRGGIKSILRIIEYEGVAFAIFFIGNLGTRLLGLKEFFKTHLFIKSAVGISIVFPLLFLQKGVASNTSQFLQYFVLLMGVLAGIAVSKITSKAKYLIPIIILVMIPTQVGLLREFYSRPAFAKISSQEMEALNFVKNSTSETSIVMSPPYNQYLNLKKTTPDIWDWFDTSYIAAFSERRTFFDDYEQVDIMGYDWKGRSEVKKTIFENTNVDIVNESFKESKANILYFPTILSPKVEPESLGLTRIFINDEIEVWKAN